MILIHVCSSISNVGVEEWRNLSSVFRAFCTTLSSDTVKSTCSSSPYLHCLLSSSSSLFIYSQLPEQHQRPGNNNLSLRKLKLLTHTLHMGKNRKIHKEFHTIFCIYHLYLLYLWYTLRLCVPKEKNKRGREELIATLMTFIPDRHRHGGIKKTI